jgi:hypothetical protein
VFKRGLKNITIILFSLLILKCAKTEENNDKIVAHVGEKKLFLSEVSQFIPNDVKNDDSIVMAKDYIRKWVNNELLVQKAEENLTPAQKNLTREIEEYRNSLIIYKYKNELMNQQMDTLVTSRQIEEYFNANPDNFKLSNNIVKAVFIKTPIELTKIDLIKDLVKDDTEEGKNALREYCIQYAKSFDFFNDSWVNFEVVKNNIPEPLSDEIQFLNRNKLIEQEDSSFYYFVYIKEYKLQNELAPKEYVEKNIKNLILNKRKIEFLKQVEENLYKEGVRQNKFEIYNN